MSVTERRRHFTVLLGLTSNVLAFSPLSPPRIPANSYQYKRYEYGTLSAAIAPYANEDVLM